MKVNYEQDMQIDPSALDIEWLGQPSLTMKYAQNAAQTKREEACAKERLDIVRAQLDNEIRSNPESFGLAKATEASIQSAILLQKEYQEASKEYIDAKYESDLARYAASAISDRKEALENLVRLHGMQYFAGPTIPRDLNKEWETKIKQQDVDSRVRLTRRVRREDD